VSNVTVAHDGNAPECRTASPRYSYSLAIARPAAKSSGSAMASADAG
jgi:hypothetical protein